MPSAKLMAILSRGEISYQQSISKCCLDNVNNFVLASTHYHKIGNCLNIYLKYEFRNKQKVDIQYILKTNHTCCS